MKSKIFISFLCGVMMAGSVEAAPRKNCSYSPLQEVIRNARSSDDIDPLIQNNVDLNAPQKCGGNVLQLAIVRGNPHVLKAILQGGQMNVNEVVSLDMFPIAGAPKQVPLIMFAAYYAPRADMLQLIISAGANLMVVDDKGENILWYLEQNPVLNNTDLSDEITNRLLYQQFAKKEEPVSIEPDIEAGENHQTSEEQKKEEDASSQKDLKKAPQVEKTPELNIPNKEASSQRNKRDKSRQKIVEIVEPDRAVKPDDFLTESDFN